MNKKIIGLVVVGLLIMTSFSVLAAEESETSEDQPKQEEQETTKEEQIEINFDENEAGGAKGNGGPMVGFIQLDFSGLNDVLTNVSYNGGIFGSFDQ
jgi:hypothetical protein